MELSSSSRQPERQPWTMGALLRERTLAMSHSLELSTRHTYSSGLNSWIAFVNMHHFDIEPTPDTMSFFIVYMSRHISPRSVKAYLSGIVQSLEHDFPNVREIRQSRLVTRALKGCLKMFAKPVQRKDPVSVNDLRFVEAKYRHSQDHDDFLFVALLFTGFHGLNRLGELTFPDDPSIRDWRKVIRRSSLILRPHEYTFQLPAHKADRFFEGNKVVVCAFPSTTRPFDPFPSFLRYLLSRDSLFPASSPLWLTSSGKIPTRSFFISRFRSIFSKSYGGASMRAGGATHLAKNQTTPECIRAIGRWSSDAWQVYIRIHPTLLQALIHS
jgi:hypothetical protein